jgi:hypothetical protein
VAKPHQLLAVEPIGPAEVVDDFGNRFSGDGMTLVVGQLDRRYMLTRIACIILYGNQKMQIRVPTVFEVDCTPVLL